MKRRKGFTLMEMLIVVAIIAVLIAIAIPVLSSVLEKAKEATDLANIRSAYAEISAKYLTGEDTDPITVEMKQTKAGWDTKDVQETLEGLFKGGVVGAPADGNENTALIEWISDDSTVKVTFNGEGSGGSDTPEPAEKYDYDNKKAIITTIGNIWSNALQNLVPEQYKSGIIGNMHTWSPAYTVDDKTYSAHCIELSLPTMFNDRKGAYWVNGNPVTWSSYLESEGMDIDKIKNDTLAYTGGDDGSYVYFDEDYNVVAISYYVDKSVNNNYRYVLFEDGQETIIQYGSMPGNRALPAYDKEYALLPMLNGQVIEQ